MPYSRITRSNPAAIVFLIDQSGSMDEGSPKKKERLARAVNQHIFSLMQHSTRDDGVRNYFHVGIIGYGDDAGPVFQSEDKKILIPIRDLAYNPVGHERVAAPALAGDRVAEGQRLPIWVKPVASGMTSMGAALQLAATEVERWLGENDVTFPPVVFNVSDGEASDDNVVPLAVAARRLQALRAKEGNVVLFNICLWHLNAPPQVFPESDAALPEKLQPMFPISSPVPDFVRDGETGLGPDARCLVFNADFSDLPRLFAVGTPPRRLW